MSIFVSYALIKPKCLIKSRGKAAKTREHQTQIQIQKCVYTDTCVRMMPANTALAVIMNVKQPNEFTCTLCIRIAADKVAIELGIEHYDVSYTCMNI